MLSGIGASRGLIIMGASLPTLDRANGKYVIFLTEDQVYQRGLREGQPVEVQPVRRHRVARPRPSVTTRAHRYAPPDAPPASHGLNLPAIVETFMDVVASKIALAQYRRYGKAVARDADDVLRDLNL